MDPDRLHDGLRISALSLGWTIVAGSAAVLIGLIGNSLALAAFGAVGLVDAVGSGALIRQFRRAIRLEAISPRDERVTLLVVSVGMALVGLATIADSAYRLDEHLKSRPSLPGIVLAAVSVLVLLALSVGKRRIARGIPSDALRADGWLSAVGALLATVALAGTAVVKVADWWSADPIAAIAVGGAAVALSIQLCVSSAT
jgi:divalent metal cation (Fe/Co/Zn/Cd) transporter